MNPTTRSVPTAGVFALLTATLLPAAAHAQCTPTFAIQQPGYAADIPLTMALVDLNSDGKPDILTGGLVSGGGASACSILLNNGAGTFGAPTRINLTGSGAQFAQPADFNSDGKPDVACILGSGNSTVAILLGNGTGGFAAPAYIPVGTAPFNIITGDFNNDGKVDLLLTLNNASAALVVMYGNGNGTFTAPATITAGVGGFGVAAADLNGDNRLDLVIAAAFANNLNVLFGTGAVGAGAFTAGPTYTVTSPRSVTTADLDADGRPDVIVGLSTPEATIFRGTGAPTGALTLVGTISTGNAPTSMLARDINGDGKPDLVVGSSTYVNVLLGTANLTAGPAGAFAAPTSFSPGSSPNTVAAGDVNGDGSPDLAVGVQTALPVSVMLNTSPAYARPLITLQPAGLIVASGAPASFTSAATGFGPALSYRWRRNGQPLSNGGNIAGATTPTLSINPATGNDVGYYTFEPSSASACIVGATVSTLSSQAILAVTGNTVPTNCIADLGTAGGIPGHDGFLDNNDFIAFISAFFNHTGCP